MAGDFEVGASTLALLEARLQRVNYALTGEAALTIQASAPDTGSTTIAARLRTLERHLQTLSTRCEAASEVLALHGKQPDIFHPSHSSTIDSSIHPSALAAIILSHAQLYQQLATQLDTCSSKAIPDPSTLVPLVKLQARVNQVAAKQVDQTRKLAELRTQSAQVLETWYTQGVLEMSECWTDWEERLRDVEILVRRLEAAKKREEGYG